MAAPHRTELIGPTLNNPAALPDTSPLRDLARRCHNYTKTFRIHLGVVLVPPVVGSPNAGAPAVFERPVGAPWFSGNLNAGPSVRSHTIVSLAEPSGISTR